MKIMLVISFENLEENFTLINKSESMFQIFLKKQQYGKVSSKFKNHFEQRGDRVSFVTSSDTNIEDKMHIFNQLINDGVNIQKNPTIIKSSYFRQKKKPKANELYDKQINELGQMTDGFIEWNNAKIHKNKQKENVFSWGNYKEGKQERKQKQEANFGQILKQRLNLTQLQMTHRTERFQTHIKAKLQNNIFQKDKLKPFDMSCRHSPEKGIYMLELYKQKYRKKQKLEKYFGQMKQFSCHKNLNSESSSNLLKPLKILQKSMNSTAYCTPFNYGRSGRFTPCESTSRVRQFTENQKDDFRDDRIYSDMNDMKARMQQAELQAIVTSTVPMEEMRILGKSDSNFHVAHKNLQKLRKLPLSTVKTSRINRDKELSSDNQRNIFRTTVKCPFDINKLNAVKKVQCL